VAAHISPRAVVETSSLGLDVEVHEFAIVREGVTLGDGVVVHPFVVIEPGTTVGSGSTIFPGCHLGKPPHGAGATAREVAYEGGVTIGRGCAVGPNAVIFADVQIGDNTLIGDGASIREGGRIGSRCIISRHVTLNYSVRVGDETKVMDVTHLTGDMAIGAGVFISVGVITVNDNKMGAEGYDSGRIAGPIIGDLARIGAGAVLLPRVSIGREATVAAGAVVTRDVQPGVRVAGVPAREMRPPG
jgi:acetyltransferase-like isoleucine patch superfamily enzyme